MKKYGIRDACNLSIKNLKTDEVYFNIDGSISSITYDEHNLIISIKENNLTEKHVLEDLKRYFSK